VLGFEEIEDDEEGEGEGEEEELEGEAPTRKHVAFNLGDSPESQH